MLTIVVNYLSDIKGSDTFEDFKSQRKNFGKDKRNHIHLEL